MRSPRAPFTTFAAVCLALAVAGAGCAQHSSGSSFVTPQYPDGAVGLKQLWSDIIEAAQHDERERVHDLMATTFMSDAELARLFGPATPPLVPRYHQLMGTLVNRGAIELVANVFDRRYDAVDVLADENDVALHDALVEPHALWSVRVHKASETRGLRYDGFFYLDGKWRTANQLGKFVAPGKSSSAPVNPAAPPAKSDSAPAKSGTPAKSTDSVAKSAAASPKPADSAAAASGAPTSR